MPINRNKFIDDLIGAGATDDEISEALQLAESRNEFSAPETIKQPQAEAQPSQPGYFSEINQAMDDKAMEYAQKNLQTEKYPLQHAVQKFNSIVDIPLSGLSKAVQPITQNPTVKKVAGAFGEAAMEMADGPLSMFRDAGVKGATIGNIAQGASKLNEKYPVLGEVGQLAGNVVGLGGAGKIGTTVGKEALKLPAKTGSALEATGKSFKLGDMKIKDSIAKKGYGQDLIEKKENIANTIYDYGLTHGGNKGGAAKAAQLSQEIFDKVDNMVADLAASPNAPKANPVKELLNEIDPMKAPAGKRKQAQAIIDGIVEDLNVEGLNQDHTIDKLIQAKRSLDPDGNLFKNGPGTTQDDILDRAIRKKMYLNLVEKIGDISPEIKALNREAKKLIDAESALSAAASRTANKDAISLTDWVLGAGTIANPHALPLLAVKKGLAGGRGSDLLLNTSRALQGKKEKTIDDILTSVAKNTDLEKSTNVDLPMGYNLPTFYRKSIPIIERDGRLVSKGEDYTVRDWPSSEPVDLAKIAEELVKMKKQGMLGITR